jgi:hypothetical protein
MSSLKSAYLSKYLSICKDPCDTDNTDIPKANDVTPPRDQVERWNKALPKKRTERKASNMAALCVKSGKNKKESIFDTGTESRIVKHF